MTIAGGWLGWSEEQTLHSDVNFIVQSYMGRIEMLRACFGGGADDATNVKPSVGPKQQIVFDEIVAGPLSTAIFDDLFEDSGRIAFEMES